MNLKNVDLAKLNSMTKYPSIPTYHRLTDNELIIDEIRTPFPENTELTIYEKVDGTGVRHIHTPQDDLTLQPIVVVGSREELLWCNTELFCDPMMGIVDFFRPNFKPFVHDIQSIHVFYGELYGYQIGKAAKQYSQDKAREFRLFDIAVIEDYEEILAMDIQKISSWRENGGQRFIKSDNLLDYANRIGQKIVPPLGTINSNDLPKNMKDTHEWLKRFVESKSCINQRTGKSEGVVIRTDDRKTIAKIRFINYERTERAIAEGKYVPN